MGLAGAGGGRRAVRGMRRSELLSPRTRRGAAGEKFSVCCLTHTHSRLNTTTTTRPVSETNMMQRLFRSTSMTLRVSSASAARFAGTSAGARAAPPLTAAATPLTASVPTVEAFADASVISQEIAARGAPIDNTDSNLIEEPVVSVAPLPPPSKNKAAKARTRRASSPTTRAADIDQQPISWTSWSAWSSTTRMDEVRALRSLARRCLPPLMPRSQVSNSLALALTSSRAMRATRRSRCSSPPARRRRARSSLRRRPHRRRSSGRGLAG